MRVLVDLEGVEASSYSLTHYLKLQTNKKREY
jgi:hypothetical protein